MEQFVNHSGVLPEGRVVHIVEQICGALAEAHEAGLVHRDIKPANIMVGYRGGLGDFVKVLDFGLVKPVDGRGDANLTNAGAFTGTPLYISPEGVNRPGEVGPRSDLYSLGATAYFLLTGTPVFDGRNPVDICLKHVTQTPPKPSEKRQLPLAEDIEQVVMQCLAKEPAERPKSARALLSSLATCQATGSWSQEMAADWWGHADRLASLD